ncbi:hypothetical protein T190130A13A_50307 [Tenacibaculum sp. 190130A14a]|uniref:Uncharacterized protein n=1 Tax=Tenacibaculum polynesiense TaxID=3137857 RepID=A0ABP1F628_9FLAO
MVFFRLLTKCTVSFTFTVSASVGFFLFKVALILIAVTAIPAINMNKNKAIILRKFFIYNAFLLIKTNNFNKRYNFLKFFLTFTS